MRYVRYGRHSKASLMFSCPCGFHTEKELGYPITCRCGVRYYKDKPPQPANEKRPPLELEIDGVYYSPGDIPTEGPGTELHKLFLEIKIRKDSCERCLTLLATMNVWGPNRCRENKPQIVNELKSRAHEFNFGEKAKAAVMALVTGLAFELNWLDPFPGLVDEAIRRAKLKAAI